MKRKSLVVAAAVALGMVASTSVLAVTPFGNNSQKGSLLIYPRVEVGDGIDTIITIVNDSAFPVRLKCYYATSLPVATPSALTLAQRRALKRKFDFTIDLTHNQPVAWYASSGFAVTPSERFAGGVAPPFGIVGGAGELKCWASSDDYLDERTHNHLFGTASIMNLATTQAWEYTAWAFQRFGAADPGALNLDGSEYDWCPNTLVGDFIPRTAVDNLPGAPSTQVTLASCSQDLRQQYFPFITKLTWTFWDQDERARTGNHACANSWYETFLGTGSTFLADTIRTAGAYFRIAPTVDTSICGPDTVDQGYVGVKADAFGAGFVRGTNLTGRGLQAGTIFYDVGSPDETKR